MDTSFRHVMAKKREFGLECVKHYFLPLKFDIFLGKSCKPYKPLVPGLVYLLCSPHGSI